MKCAAFAQRLVFILFSVALTSIAIGAPPEWAEGEPPPFHEEGCTFEQGRTTCIETIDGTDQYMFSMTMSAGSTCEGGTGVLKNVYDIYSVQSVTARVVYYGTSHIIESQEPLYAAAGSQVRWDLMYSFCDTEV